MSSHSWLDVWKLFLDVVSRESIAAQIAIGLGAAFAAVMALEGIRASFFPKRIAESVALRNAVMAPVAVAAPVAPLPEEDMRAAAIWTPAAEPALEVLPEPVAYVAPQRAAARVNTDFARRSSPRRMRVIGQRKPI